MQRTTTMVFFFFSDSNRSSVISFWTAYLLLGIPVPLPDPPSDLTLVLNPDLSSFFPLSRLRVFHKATGHFTFSEY